MKSMPPTPARLASAPPVGPAAPLSARERIENRVRGQLMQMALRELLDKVRGSRDALPHLAALEQALGARGVMAVSEVAPRWRAKMSAQLSCLPVPDDDRELKALRALLGGGLQNPKALCADQQPALSDFLTDSRLQIGEVSHSAFTQALAAVQGPVA